MIYWFCGQSGTGKTTLANRLKLYFDILNRPSIHLDGDDLRKIFGGTYKQEHFVQEYRDTNTRKLQKFVEYIEAQGINVIVSTVNSNKIIREELKQRNPNVIEIIVINNKPFVREHNKYSDFEYPTDNFISIDTGLEHDLEINFKKLLTELTIKKCI